MSNFAHRLLPGRHGHSIILTLLIALLVPLAAHADPTLTLSGDLLPGGELEIGGHLDAAFSGVVPFEHYSILLVDESEQEVASLLNQQAGLGGGLPADRLWTRTGVVGCDPDVVHEPTKYFFESFDEAEAILHGRVFEVRLIEGTNRSRVLDVVRLEMRSVTDFIEGWPSDGAGCLRTLMRTNESLYLAIEHQGGATLSLQINLVQAQSTWLPGDPIVDVRGAPQIMHVPASASPWVELMWLTPVEGEYQVIVRPVNGDGGFDPAVDLMLETGVKLVGATANQCGAVCPP